MTKYHEVEPGRMWMGKLAYGADLLQALTDFCKENNIVLGWVRAIGAVQRACLGFYDQGTLEYRTEELYKPLEITNLTGNISLKDGSPIVHAHITLSDEHEKAFGGHLVQGTTVFACEFLIQELKGPAFERGFDEKTHLPLWQM